MYSNWRLPSVNSLTAGIPSLLEATRTLFPGPRLSTEALKQLEQQSEATQHLLQGTVVPGDLQQMQNSLTTVPAPLGAAPAPFHALPAAPPPSSQRPSQPENQRP